MPEKITRALLLFAIPLATLASLDGAPQILKIVGPMSFLGWAWFMWLTGSQLAPATARTWIVWAFVAIVVIALVRCATSDPPFPLAPRPLMVYALALTALTVFVSVALLERVPADVHRGRLVCIALAPAAFTTINLALHLVGFRFGTSVAGPQSFGNSVVLGLVGIQTPRAEFPMTPGLTGSGAMAMLGLVMAVMLVRAGSTGWTRRFSWAAIAFCAYTALLADARAALLWGVVTIAMLALLPRAGRRVVTVVPWLLPVAPLLILQILRALASVVDKISRNPGDALTAGGRAEIWDITFSYLGQMNPIDLIGHGAYGQEASEASYSFVHFFTNQTPYLNTVHNVALQAILDTGYLGLFVMLLAFASAIGAAALKQQNSPDPVSLALLAGLVLIALTGSNEAIPSIYVFHMLAAFVVVGTAATIPAPSPAGEPARPPALIPRQLVRA